MKKYKCLLCGIVFESDDAEPICPVCGAGIEELEEVTEEGE